VRDLPAEALLHGHAQHREITDAVEEVNRASVVFVATPIYKASLAGILKAFLDLLPQNALSSKPVLPLGTGGSPAHLLAVEYALKPVLAALGAQVFFPTLYIQDTQIVQLEPPQFEPDAERRLSAVVEVTTAYFVQHPVEVKVTT
jgi:FMN reductase